MALARLVGRARGVSVAGERAREGEGFKEGLREGPGREELPTAGERGLEVAAAVADMLCWEVGGRRVRYVYERERRVRCVVVCT